MACVILGRTRRGLIELIFFSWSLTDLEDHSIVGVRTKYGDR